MKQFALLRSNYKTVFLQDLKKKDKIMCAKCFKTVQIRKNGKKKYLAHAQKTDCDHFTLKERWKYMDEYIGKEYMQYILQSESKYTVYVKQKCNVCDIDEKVQLEKWTFTGNETHGNGNYRAIMDCISNVTFLNCCGYMYTIAFRKNNWYGVLNDKPVYTIFPETILNSNEIKNTVILDAVCNCKCNKESYLETNV
jgi:hypothetical protein